ncbi:fibronectin type III domain-containing protein [Halorussus salinus]|uniref:fibronectin type III domain-containing protein n=1 Tax=Halorussus salinus TaxID=1364935 RepID=UPI001091BD71|nr:fibronectin type III domain-containing protein [Halorussus salinus]
MPVRFTTELPDASIDTLDDSTEDEITVEWTDVIDYGQYEIEYRQSSASAWLDGPTVSQSTTTATVTGLEDGEEYEFRLRTTTEHVTGSWATANVVTDFPAPTTPTATLSESAPKTTIDLSWGDVSDNEDGFRVLRSREFDYGWGPFQQVADLSVNATSHTDDTCSPSNTYRYKIEAYTEDGSSRSAATESVTTDASGEPRTRTDANGWTVEVEHESGRTLRPRLLDNPTFRPALNDYPRIEIPVPRDEKWQSEGFEEATLSVWQDGRILPIDTLVEVRVEDDRAVLVGRGGSELGQRVQTEYDNTEAHVAARELVQQETGYTPNVDDPSSGITETRMQSGATTQEFEDSISPDATDPYHVTDGRVETLQTCYLGNWGDWDWEVGSYRTGSDWNATSDRKDDVAEVFALDAHYASVEFSFTPEYDVPAGSVQPFVRWGNPDGIITDGHELSVVFDGTDVPETELLHFADGFGLAEQWKWFEFPEPRYGLTAGETYTLRISIDVGSKEELGNDDPHVDVLGCRDARFEYTDDNSVDENHALSGPETYPDAQEVEFSAVSSVFNVTGGRIEGTWTDTSNGQSVALSNDDGTNWTAGSNTTTFGTKFADSGSSIAWRTTLGRHGTQSGVTPTTGFKPQAIESFTLYADLEDTPVLDGQTYDGALADVLKQIADYGNFVWELQRDQQKGWSIEWTQPGQRTAESDEGIADYSVSKSVEKAYEKVVVKGAAQPIRAEEFTADHGQWTGLDHRQLVPATEIVRNPSDGTTYELGNDYELDRSKGRVKTLSSGGMSDGTTYEIDYRYKTEGSYTSKDADSDPDTLVKTIANVTSNRGCEQAALYLVQRLQNPVWNASVTLPKAAAGRSLVDDLALEDLPTNGNGMEIRSLEQTPRQVTLELGSRKSVSDLVSDLNSRVNSVADRV